MDLAGALDWLFSTQLFGIKLGLEQTRGLLEAGGVMPAEGVLVVHVAGTNGKGSTCAMVEALARAGGMKTGLFTSPHLVHFSERIRVDGRAVGDEDLLRLLSEAKKLAESREQAPTFFELALYMALKFFKEQGVEIIILETGLGGRLDATNAVPKDIAVLTPVDLDHQQYLGDTLAQVAAEKAGIIAEGKPVVSARQGKEAEDVIRREAERRHAPLSFVEADERTPEPSLWGEFQRQNAALAIAALKELGRLPRPDVVREALSAVEWSGRFERIASARLVLDGAHNPHAAKVLVAAWKKCFGDRKTKVVFAASADKSVEKMAELLEPVTGEWHVVPCVSPRIMGVSEMADLLRRGSSIPVVVHGSLAEGLAEAAKGDVPGLVTGSLFLVGEVKGLLEDEAVRRTLQ